MKISKFTLGEIIRGARERKGMTRTKLAEFTGISPNTLAKYEKAQEEGGKTPGLPKMVKLARALEIDPRWIFQRISDHEHDDGDHFSFVENFKSAEDRKVDRDASWAATTEILANEFSGFRADLDEIKKMIKRNGPDQKDPSRSENSTNETEVVDATSTNKPGGN